MATLNKVMEQVSRTKPNAIAAEDQARWLLELDRRIYEEITGPDDPERVGPREFPEDGDMELVVRAPYDNVYDLYLTAMIEYTLQEYEFCNNTLALFENAYNMFRAKWRRDHCPAGEKVLSVFR